MATSGEEIQFVLCIENGNTDDLEKGKIYQVLADTEAQVSGYLRIVDESKEDYLYPVSWFAPIELPGGIKKTLLA